MLLAPDFFLVGKYRYQLEYLDINKVGTPAKSILKCDLIQPELLLFLI